MKLLHFLYKKILKDLIQLIFHIILLRAYNSYYLIGDLINAEKHIDIVINEMNPLTGKAEYIKAIIFIAMGDNLGACPFLQISLDSGYEQARQAFEQNCS